MLLIIGYFLKSRYFVYPWVTAGRISKGVIGDMYLPFPGATFYTAGT